MVSHRRPFLVDVLIAAGLFILAIASFAPLFWELIASFKPEAEIMVFPPRLFGFVPTLDNYREVLSSGFTRGMLNSLFYAATAVFIAVVAGSHAAFGFDRFRFRGRNALFLLVVASIPLATGAAALLVPNYLFFTRLGITNQWFTLPLIYAVHNLPIAIWILKGSLESVPKELDEAAIIDGASSLTILWRIVLPLCRPALGAAALLVFISSWNEFMAGSIMVDSPELKPVQPLLYQYIGFYGRQWGLLTAAACLAVLPIFVIYSLFGRLLISGMTRGAVKG